MGRWLGIGLVIVLLCLAGWWVLRPKTVGVRTEPVRETSSTSEATVLNASGYVVARRQATVSSKVTGRVAEVLIEEGDHVGEGEVLARLDGSNVEANLRLAQAQLESARSNLEETRVRLDEAQREFRRVNDLADQKIASASDLDAARAEMNSLEARLQSQAAAIVVAERQVALWRQQMDDLTIRAPFAGVVVSKNAQPGEMISPISAGGGFTRTGICTIVDMSSREIEVDVGESYINRVETGQAVVATLDAYPDWKIPAEVIATVPTADRQKATVKVRVAFRSLDSRILPEMGVKVAFKTADGASPATGSRVVTVSEKALHRQGDQVVAWVVHDGLVERRAVTAGPSINGEATVMSGLAAGERVVVETTGPIADSQHVEEMKP